VHKKTKPRNLAGRMGKKAPQPSMMQMTVSPLGRLDQKAAGRKQGKSMRKRKV
tara:strand:+ start:766 stop:924 length:159 start_codon:yes stop_codon:yes gene_type:complete